LEHINELFDANEEDRLSQEGYYDVGIHNTAKTSILNSLMMKLSNFFTFNSTQENDLLIDIFLEIVATLNE